MYAIDLSPTAQLRPLEPWQAEEFLAHIDRARPNVDPYIPWCTFSPDLESARKTLQKYANFQAADTGRIAGIWLEGTLVGGVMLFGMDAASGHAEAGCWLEEAGQGHGLITAAMRVLLDWAFDTRGLHRIVWECWDRNERSQATAQRLGFTHEGTLREEFLYRGERRNTMVFSLLTTERKKD